MDGDIGHVVNAHNIDCFPCHNPAKRHSLRFKEGDVIVKLGASADDWLLLHSQVIESTMPALAPAFKKEWDRAESITHPETKDVIRVTTFGLKFVDDTYVLEGKDFIPQSDPLAACKVFSESEHGDGSWPSSTMAPRKEWVLGQAVSAHKRLFSFLYGMPMTLEAILQDVKFVDNRLFQYRNGGVPRMHWVVDACVAICSYAEFYGCLNLVARQILELLLHHPAIWQAAAHIPEKYARLAKKLRCSELFFDSMRHMITLKATQNWHRIGELLEISPELATFRFGHRLEQKNEVVQRLQSTLLRLQLSQSEATPSVTLTRAIYGRWLSQKLAGQVVYADHNGDPRSTTAGQLKIAVNEIEKAAASPDPGKIFGINAASTIASVFGLDRDFNGSEQVSNVLRQIVHDAAKAIADAFKEKLVDTDSDDASDDSIDRGITYRRSRFDVHEADFSYLGMEESQLPWEDNPAWSEVKQLPEFGPGEASVDLVKALGGFGDDGASGKGDMAPAAHW